MFFRNKKNDFKTLKGDNINVNYLLGDDSVMTKEKMKSLFDDFKLGKYWSDLEPLLRSEIRIFTDPKNESEIKIGQSKIGGLPDLPNNVDWFKENNGKSLSFIAQINCSELKTFEQNLKLPDNGIIYFFYSAEQEAWGFDTKDEDKFKVYYSASTDNIVRKDAPSDLEAHSIYKSCILNYKNSVSLPSWENELVRNRLNDKELGSYIEITSNEEMNKMFGYADNVQGEMELECQLVTNGLYCGDETGYNDPRRPQLEKGMGDWNLLLQIDSEEDKTGMMWGDAGRLYFWIKEQDLKNLNFDKSWFILQCY
jgi:uncharacterized protein YwqG